MATLHVAKACGTEAQRREYHLLLRAVAPALLKMGDRRGMMRKVAKRLKVPYGMHARKGTKNLVPYASTQALPSAPPSHSPHWSAHDRYA